MSLEVIHGDCLTVLPTLAAGSAALAVVDGPYNMRKAEWDKFASWDDFRAFYRPIWEQLSRVLRDNCSLYVFGTFESLAALKPDLDALGGGWRFVNHIVLRREALFLRKFDQEQFRSYLPEHYEDCLFYARERVNVSALAAEGDCQGNPIQAYLRSERERAGLTNEDIDNGCGWVTKAFHFFALSASNWCFPTRQNYEDMRDLFNTRGNGSGPYLRREYEDLRREYEDLRREYEDLRYYFAPQMGVTDVWDVPICAGSERVKMNGETAHVAQKPLALLTRILRASCPPDGLVIDPMAGLGTTLVACAQLGLSGIGIEREADYVRIAEARIAAATQQGRLALPETREPELAFGGV